MAEHEDELLYEIALTMVPGIGCVQSRLLIEHFKKASAIFQSKEKELSRVENVGSQKARQIKSFSNFKAAEAEIKFLRKNKIEALFFSNENYPSRLRHCYDAPVLLYYKGNANLNAQKIITIIGTRKNSDYGKWATEKLINDLSGFNITVVSGLAFGIDAVAHKSALQNQLPTIGILAHGLNHIYPAQHNTLARDMLKYGGLLTEFPKDTLPDKHNFPKRNRIAAGISDATIVIETAIKGGSMITAGLANNYNRDVFALPGKINDLKSEGCNYLIKNNKAILLTDARQLIEVMGWDQQRTSPPIQQKLFEALSADEAKVVSALQLKSNMHADELQVNCDLGSSALAAAILNLELQNLVSCLPGKMYRLA